MHRREFLKRAALAAGGLAVGTQPRLAPAAGPDLVAKATGTVATLEGMAKSILNEPADSSPIDTIVVMMMENRSFDHYFGWLGTDQAYLAAGRSRYGVDFTVEAANGFSYLDRETGLLVPTYHLPTKDGEEDPYRGCGHPDPGHGPVQGRAQRDGGFLAPQSDNDVYALGYFLAEDIPLYSRLARSFTIFDHYHCSLLSSTYPNRMYLHSAQSGGIMDPPLPIDSLGYDWPTIWDRLLAQGVPCAYYGTDLPVPAFWGPRLVPIVRPLAGFFADAAAGRLPRVVFVDPGFMSGFRTDDHPHGDMRVAQKFTANVFRAFQGSPQWASGAFFITYDEWGGFFDHVAPPIFTDDGASSDDLQNFGQAGFRVPTILASPFARPGYVDHRLYDHTSILRFIEWRFLGAPAEGTGGSGWWLAARDRAANNIGASLGTMMTADVVLDPIPELPVGSKPCQGQYFQDVPGAQEAEDALLPGSSEHRMETAYRRGFFEAMGYSIAPSMSLRELIGG